MNVGVILELPTPGVQDTGKTGQSCADEALILGEQFQGVGRGFEHGLVTNLWMGADDRAKGLRDGEGDQEVRTRELLIELFVQPRLGFMVLTLGTMSIATGVRDAVAMSTAVALIEAVSVCSRTTLADGRDDFAVCLGEVGMLFEILRGIGGEDVGDGGHSWNLASQS